MKNLKGEEVKIVFVNSKNSQAIKEKLERANAFFLKKNANLYQSLAKK